MPIKICADFESASKGVQSNNNDNNAFHKYLPPSFTYKVVYIYHRFANELLFTKEKNRVNKFF